MGKRTSESQSKHDYMITSLVRYLIEQGYTNIKSSHLGHFENPSEMPGRDGNTYTSDVIAWKDGKEYIFEVETSETIDLDYTKEQFEAFYDYARGHQAEFNVLVPKKSEGAVKHLLNHMNMAEVKIWTI
jgi:Holliday junction resolvase